MTIVTIHTFEITCCQSPTQLFLYILHLGFSATLQSVSRADAFLQKALGYLGPTL